MQNIYKCIWESRTILRFEKQVDAVDDELDKLDDEFEYAYQMKEISFETYKARERTIENWKMNWN